MKLNQFSLSQVVFEVRYSEAFELWDCAGQIHRALVKIWPTVTLVESAPNKQTLRSEVVQIQTGSRSSSVMLFTPSSVVQRSDAISQTFKLWAQALQISSLERIGTRVIMRREVASEAAAGSETLKLKGLAVPGEAFGHKEKPSGIDIKLSWKSEAVGSTFSIRTEQQKLEIETTPEFAEYRKKIEKIFLVIDLDRFTVKPLSLDQFRVEDWLQGVHRLVTRDMSQLIDGAEA